MHERARRPLPFPLRNSDLFTSARGAASRFLLATLTYARADGVSRQARRTRQLVYLHLCITQSNLGWWRSCKSPGFAYDGGHPDAVLVQKSGLRAEAGDRATLRRRCSCKSPGFAYGSGGGNPGAGRDGYQSRSLRSANDCADAMSQSCPWHQPRNSGTSAMMGSASLTAMTASSKPQAGTSGRSGR